MAQQLEMNTALPEDQSLVPAPHRATRNHLHLRLRFVCVASVSSVQSYPHLHEHILIFKNRIESLNKYRFLREKHKRPCPSL